MRLKEDIMFNSRTDSVEAGCGLQMHNPQPAPFMIGKHA